MSTGETRGGGEEEELGGLDVDELRTLARVEQRMFGASTTVRIDRYEVQEPLGGGGMGVVFAAWDPELCRRVAIKLVQVRGSAGAGLGTGGAARLLREAQAIARISHPHVVPVHDVGTYGDDDAAIGLAGAAARGVFLVMELVDGVDLGRWLDERKRPWPEVLAAFMAAGEGLAAAHACGVLHRDFKPTNVLVGRDGRVRVLDFGLARAIDRPHDDEAVDDEPVAPVVQSFSEPLTHTGKVMGTPYFMPPEQLADGTTDARGDQYAFCVALYYGLVGRGPFTPGPMRDVLDVKQRGLVLPLPEDAGVPRWLERAMRRGLEPDPDKRFPSMRALLDALAHGRHRRRTIVRTAMLGGTVALAIGLGLGLGSMRDPEPNVAPGVVASTEPEAATPRIGFLRFEIEGGGEELAWAADGVPNLMAEELRGHEGLDVIGYYRLEGRLSGEPRPRWHATALEHGATMVVTGTIVGSDGRLELRLSATGSDGAIVLSRVQSTEPALLVEHARALALDIGALALGRPLAENARDAHPLSYDRSLQLGISALEHFELATAQAHLDEARRLAPESPEVHFYGAIVADWMGRHAEAEAELDVAAKGPLSPSKRLFVAAFRKGVLRQYAEAVTEYEAALARFPDDIYLAYGLFEALYHAGRGDAAIEAFRRLHELSPGFDTGVTHVLDRAAASRNAEVLAWAIGIAAKTDPATAEPWRARERIMLGDPRGALVIAEPLAERSVAEAELAVAAHALAGDIELAHARAEQILAKGMEQIDLARLALFTAMGDEAGRRSAFDREHARIARAPVTDHNTLEWIALLVHELPIADAPRIALVAEGLEGSLSERFAGDLRVQMARALIAGAQANADALATARASPYDEVRHAALAFEAAARGDPRAAADHWARAAALALDHRFVVVERWHQARELVAAGDHEGVVAACAEVVAPASFDWSWGSAVGPCLAWSAAAHASLGDAAEAQRVRTRLFSLRTRAAPDDPLRRAASD